MLWGGFCVYVCNTVKKQIGKGKSRRFVQALIWERVASYSLRAGRLRGAGFGSIGG